MGNGTVVAKLQNITKRYGAVTAVDDLTLEIQPGEILSLLGPNGAGKTTTINLLLGLARPTSGSATLFGIAPNDLNARRRVGAMLQSSVLESRARVAECVAQYAGYYPRPMRVAEALQHAGIQALAQRPVAKLSGGQRQRLMFALALCGNPEFLFLDEPTAGLDVEARRALWSALRTLAADGRTIVLTTHYLEEADALADRVVVLNRGRVIAEGAPAAIKSRVALRRIRCVTRVKAESVGQLPDVQSVVSDGSRLDIATARPESVLRELLWQDPALSDLEVTGARLEDAFMALTREQEKAA
ncbi:MAG TPA: ABC transporter ATP-binding protein [Gammaproteobacteria bacterium]|jgi:ABC-2 type transport system ATP-binding protein|nr:ABC transporter ATP-binding protein [Gammaproteobacteria bacterium]